MMQKRAIGSIGNRRLIEGNADLLEENEILVDRSADPIVLKEWADGKTKVWLVLPLDRYINDMKQAYKEGSEKQS